MSQKTKKEKNKLHKCHVILEWLPYQKNQKQNNLLKKVLLGHWQNFNNVCVLDVGIIVNIKLPELDNCAVSPPQ